MAAGKGGFNVEHFGFGAASKGLFREEVVSPEEVAKMSLSPAATSARCGGGPAKCTAAPSAADGGCGRKPLFNFPIRCGMGAMGDAVDVFESMDSATSGNLQHCGGATGEGDPLAKEGRGDDDPILSYRAGISRDADNNNCRDQEEDISTCNSSRRKPPVAEIRVQSGSNNPAKASSDRSQRTRSTAGSTRHTSDSSLTNTHDGTDAGGSRANGGYAASGGELLFDLLTSREYGAVSELLKTTLGRDMAAVSHVVRGSDADGPNAYPLHLICDYERDFATGRDSIADDEVRDRAELIGVRGNKSDPVGAPGPPPAEVVLALLEAYPAAAAKRGYDGRLPLHHAARRRHFPSEAVSAVVRANPRALDTRDYRGLTPRDYAKQHYTAFLREVMGHDHDALVSSDDDPPSASSEAFARHALLERPSSCWLQQARDEETQVRMDAELRELEHEAAALGLELERSVAEERALAARLGDIEADVDKHEARRRGGGTGAAAARIEEVLERELRDMGKKLEAVAGAMEMQYADDVRERKHVAEFSDDVKAVYEDIRGAMDELELELQTMKMSSVM